MRPKLPDNINSSTVYYIELQELLLAIINFAKQQINFNEDLMDNVFVLKDTLQNKIKEYDVLMMDLEQRIWEIEKENMIEPYLIKNIQ